MKTEIPVSFYGASMTFNRIIKITGFFFVFNLTCRNTMISSMICSRTPDTTHQFGVVLHERVGRVVRGAGVAHVCRAGQLGLGEPRLGPEPGPQALLVEVLPTSSRAASNNLPLDFLA